MNDAELREAIVAAAYLEGDFVLRSGKRSRYYLDKSRFETRPDILAALGDRIAAAVREHEPEAVRLDSPRRLAHSGEYLDVQPDDKLIEKHEADDENDW